MIAKGIRIPLAIVAVIVLLSPAAFAQRSRAARFPDFGRILVITAHPDDETLVAPFLGSRCGVTSDCSIVVMTHGENGPCEIPSGCGPDLGATRANEMAAAAAFLHLKLQLWSLPDVMSDVVAQWGGHDALVARLADVITTAKPTAIVTFDPAHGSTCHPAHRALGLIVAEAAGKRPLFFIETRAVANGESYVLSSAVDPATSSTNVFDASPSWHFITDDMRLHASQFSAASIESVASSSYKTIRLAPAGSALSYTAPCD